MNRFLCLCVLALAALLVPVQRASAQQLYDATWYSIDCGGETSSLGSFDLAGSIGQPDAGAMSGNGYDLSGGFWTTNDAAGCGSADFNCDGDIGTDLDIEAFFACLGGNCPGYPCPNSADFNGDGDVGTDGDIEAFFRVLGGGSC